MLFMITNVTKKMICVKDIPSNIIEEAIIILKKDVSIAKTQKLNAKRKEIITLETEEFMNEYIKKVEAEEMNSQKIIFQKKFVSIFFLAVLAIIACYVSLGIFLH